MNYVIPSSILVSQPVQQVCGFLVLAKMFLGSYKKQKNVSANLPATSLNTKQINKHTTKQKPDNYRAPKYL